MAAQLDAHFGSGKETAAQLEGRQAAQFGSGNETAAQLDTHFGSGKETAAQLEGGRRGGRKRLKQTNPVYYSGRAMHGGCGKLITIKEAVSQPSRGTVTVWCKHCHAFSIKKWGLKKVKEVIDLCDSE